MLQYCKLCFRLIYKKRHYSFALHHTFLNTLNGVFCDVLQALLKFSHLHSVLQFYCTRVNVISFTQNEKYGFRAQIFAELTTNEYRNILIFVLNFTQVGKQIV
jgi:hypothetical protein